jgi:hypothetical protein
MRVDVYRQIRYGLLVGLITPFLEAATVDPAGVSP